MSEADLRATICSIVGRASVCYENQSALDACKFDGVKSLEIVDEFVEILSPHLCTLHWTDRLRDVEPKPAGEITEYVNIPADGESVVLDGDFTLPELMTVVRDMLVFQDQKLESEDV